MAEIKRDAKTGVNGRAPSVWEASPLVPWSGVPVDAIFTGLTSVIVIRTILEMLLQGRHSLSPLPDFYRTAVIYAHIYISWLCVFQSMAFAMALFLRLRLVEALRLVLLFSPLINIVPLWDYALSGGTVISYGEDFADLLYNYRNLFNPLAQVTMVSGGVRIEVFLATVGAFLMSFIYFRKGVVRSLGLALSLYTIVFFFGYLPALAKAMGFNLRAFGPDTPGLSQYQAYFSLYLPVTAALIAFTVVRLWLERREYGRAALRLFDPSRLGFCLLLPAIGMLFAAQQTGLPSARPDTGDAVRLLLASMSIVLLFLYAGLRNALCDPAIDGVSHPDRPTVNGIIAGGDAAALGRVLLLLSFVFALPANPGFSLLWPFPVALWEIYSEPPLRLRRHYPFGHVILALIGAAAFMAGATLISPLEFFNIRGIPGMCGSVFLAFFFLSHLEDFKDITGKNWTIHPRLIGAAAVCFFAAALVLIARALFEAIPAAVFIAMAVYLAVSLAAIAGVRHIRGRDRLRYLSFVLFLFITALWLSSRGG